MSPGHQQLALTYESLKLFEDPTSFTLVRVGTEKTLFQTARPSPAIPERMSGSGR